MAMGLLALLLAISYTVNILLLVFGSVLLAVFNGACTCSVTLTHSSYRVLD
jgi:hypothetical protein